MSLKERFLRKFVKFYNDKPNPSGTTLQRVQWVEKYCGCFFTISIERGNKLNK